MANTYITPTTIARAALATLYNTVVLAQLVTRNYESDFNGQVGDTVTVRLGATFVSTQFNRASGITIQDATETSLTVTLNNLQDVSFAVTAEELSLKLVDFQTQLLDPAVNAIAQAIDVYLAEDLATQAKGAHASNPVTGAYTADGTGATSANLAWRQARRILSRNKLPANDRFCVLSPEAVQQALGDSLFVELQKVGSTDALQEASLGRKFGFDNYESQTFGFGGGNRGAADGVAFHRSALALVSRTLPTPMGLPSNQVATSSFGGLGLRVVKSYDVTKKQDVCSVDTLIGLKDLRDYAAVTMNFGQGS